MVFFGTAFWFGVAGVLLAIELVIPGTFFAAIFAVAALITGLVSLSTEVGAAGLIALFLFLSFVGVFVCKPVLEKLFKVNKPGRASNIDGLVGSTGVVTEQIEQDGFGYVKVDGEEWRAVANEKLTEGTRIKIEKIEGVTVTVSKVENEEVSE